jgi:hypothetical protein
VQEVGEYSELFITNEMREAYAVLDNKRVLELRLQAIMKAEEEFVREKLEIEYTK